MGIKLDNNAEENKLINFYEKVRDYKGFDEYLLDNIIYFILPFKNRVIDFDNNSIVFSIDGIQFCSVGILKIKHKINIYFTIKVSDMPIKDQEDNRFLKGKFGRDSGFGIKTLEEFEYIKGYIKIAYDEIKGIR